MHVPDTDRTPPGSGRTTRAARHTSSRLAASVSAPA